MNRQQLHNSILWYSEAHEMICSGITRIYHDHVVYSYQCTFSISNSPHVRCDSESNSIWVLRRVVRVNRFSSVWYPADRACDKRLASRSCPAAMYLSINIVFHCLANLVSACSRSRSDWKPRGDTRQHQFD